MAGSTITPPAVARPMAVATLNFLLSLANNMMVKESTGGGVHEQPHHNPASA